MLTTSPVAPTASSPSNFHYAAAQRSSHNPPTVAALSPSQLPRRQSSRPSHKSSASPSHLAQHATTLPSQSSLHHRPSPSRQSPSWPSQYVCPGSAFAHPENRAMDPTPRPDVTPPPASQPRPRSIVPQPPSQQRPSPALSQRNLATSQLSPSKRRNSSRDPPGPRSTAPSRSLPQPAASSSKDTAPEPDSPPKRHRGEAQPPKVLPLRYETMDVDDLVILIAHMLGELIQTNDPLALTTGRLTRFHSRTAPGISVRDYLQRLARHATLTPAVLLSMVYYIDRLCSMYPEFTINTLTVHRFLITAATVAAKGLSDSFWNNTTYARVGGIRVQELKTLELEFLTRVDWKIVPSPEVLVAYYRGLIKRCPEYVLEGDQEQEDEDEEISDDSVDENDAERPGAANGNDPSNLDNNNNTTTTHPETAGQ